MIWAIIILLLIFLALGFISHLLFWLIKILLVVIVIYLIIKFIKKIFSKD